MKTKLTKIFALILAVVMVACVFAGCSSDKSDDTKSTNGTESTYTGADTLVVGYSTFSSKFTPFFATTQYDMDAQSMTQVGLLSSDREGNIIMKGIEGETIAYNGTDYTYYGIADCDVVQNDDGTVDYNIKIRDDIKFSDGEPMNIDDVIFNMYVLSDPTYDGSSTFYALPIEGMADYRSGMTSKGDLILAGGREGTSEYYTDAERDEYWTAIDKAGAQMAQGIVDYVFANYLDDSYTTQMLNGLTSADVQGSDGLKVAYGMAMWGYGSFDDAGNFIDGQTDKTWDLKTTFPTVEDYWTAISTKYKDDVKTASDTEKSDNGSLFDFLPDILGDDLGNFQLGIETGTSAKNISGIIRNDDYSMTVHMTSFDAVSIYQLSISVAPMHYYGSKDAYDYANNKFGFTKGDLSGVKSVNTKPLGAGPYKFLSFEKGVITYEANESYYKGTPKIKNVLFKETAEGDKLTGVTTGTFDLTDPTFNTTTVDAIKGYNSNGELTGDVITTSCVDNLGYGYIGMNANLIKVGTTAADNGSDKSKDLRKALATLFAVHRDVVIDSYYGERATVIQYPISNTSWAAPKMADEGYEIAYSKDVDGNSIYTADMDDNAKYDAALQAAIGYLKAAGYTWDDASKKFTAAPEGAEMAYTVIIPADGSGDHPAYGILTAVKDQLATIGLTLEINDVSDGNILWNGLEAGTVEIWAAAWQATVDPDMYQIYYSTNTPEENGGSNNYHIQDSQLDQLIMDARTSADQAFRKATYKECLDIILDWACEIPNYQRQNAVIFSTERINISTLTPDITTFWGWMNDIELLEMN